MVSAGIRYGIRQLNLHRITASVDVRNTPSWKLMERIGMRREGCLIHTNLVNDEWIDDDVYAILHEEWSGIQE